MSKRETRFTVIVCSIILLPFIVLLTIFGIMNPTADDISNCEYEDELIFISDSVYADIDTIYTDTVYYENCDSIDISSLELNKENFFIVCDELGLVHSDVIYAQALLESGHFTSGWYKTHNNFLGLWNSYKSEPYSFPHWSDCLRGYRDYIQYRYDEEMGTTDEYLMFLDELGYAEDPEYDSKVRRMLEYIERV